jgi:endosialidase-like protein
MRVRSCRHPLVRPFALSLFFTASIWVVDAHASGKAPASTRGEVIALPFVTFDQVIPDDLIVQGSECVGFDCVNNESFGFDTIRLKENNLRIHFEDTSSISGFPSNDWEIRINDSQSGGGSYFGVADRNSGNLTFRVDAGAPTNALKVDSTGRVGLRTQSPVLDIHAFTSNTPAIRLDQSNAAGWTAQTWDIGANEANFFVRDVTSGSLLPFRIRPGAPTSSVDISATGDVGIGTNSPSAKLHVAAGNAQVDGAVNVTSVTAPATPASGANVFYSDRLRFQMPDGQQPLKVRAGGFSGAGGVDIDGVLRFDYGTGVPAAPTGTFYVWHELSDGTLKFRLPGGSTTAYLSNTGIWTDGSSRAFKRDIRPLDLRDAAAAVRALEPVRYYGNNGTEEQLGFIAEDVPDLVASAGRNGIAPIDIVAVLTKVVQDQQMKIDGQQTKIDAMAAEMAALKAAVEELRKR